MEKAVVMGCVCVVVSSLTPEEMKRFACYYPEAMTLKGMNFSLRLDDGPGVQARGQILISSGGQGSALHPLREGLCKVPP